ncbi:hypothetical protein OS493_018522 [Desmophyllum pertusum]|uniref:Uncharacterized protein n=1 Tax=Desmophyllum pertusum TaxID=174260 RepID=A0A9X0A1Q1_9CNID|nr:hypothetical protein OS493_018522 [Desmophyllum pertusum]
MSSNRKRSAATAFGNEVYVLVQFVEDSIYNIVKKSSINKRDDGMYEAPYGNAYDFYICMILLESDETNDDEIEVIADEPAFHTPSKNTAVGNANGGFDVDVVHDAVQLLSVSRPKIGGKQPRKQHHPLQAPHKQPRKVQECQRCIELKEKVESLKRQLVEQVNSQNIPSQPPRPGLLPLETAAAFNMAELAPGSRVFVYQTSIDVASKKAPSAAACFLLSCFFSNSELVGSNLTGANGKRQLNPPIVDAIIATKLRCSKWKGRKEWPELVSTMVEIVGERNMFIYLYLSINAKNKIDSTVYRQREGPNKAFMGHFIAFKAAHLASIDRYQDKLPCKGDRYVQLSRVIYKTNKSSESESDCSEESQEPEEHQLVMNRR